QDLVKAAEHVDQIPKEVSPVMRLFDGERTVADVIEDSTMGLGDTMRVVARLVSLGVIKKLTAPRPHAGAGAALLIEDWIVGQSAPEEKPKRRTPAHGQAAVDWGNLGAAAVPAAASYAPVVPSQTATGEIMAIGSTPVASKQEGAEAKNVGNNGRST